MQPQPDPPSGHLPGHSPGTVPWPQALRFWLKLGCISFGGPAGQIALMHRELVEQRRWISEGRFAHALNYCMLLPGPEAQQLATYIGWLLHRTWGGIAAGALFVLPSLLLLLGLSAIYLAYGRVPWVAGVFYGLQSAVVALVLQALHRMAGRILGPPRRTPWLWALAIGSLLAVHLGGVAFPWVVLCAAGLGLLGGRWAPQQFAPAARHTAPALVSAPAPALVSAAFPAALPAAFPAAVADAARGASPSPSPSPAPSPDPAPASNSASAAALASPSASALAAAPATWPTGSANAPGPVAAQAPLAWVIGDDTPIPPHARFQRTRLLAVLLTGLVLWALPMAALLLWQGGHGTLTQMGLFFTQAALLTFGGAYAVLPYVVQGAVLKYGWLSSTQMMDGLALGETTPGPLIMVVAFVGFLGGYSQQVLGPQQLWLGATLAALVVTWFTFLPSFIFILAGGPLVEHTRRHLGLSAPLTAINAAVVGVVASLALFFVAHVAVRAEASGGFFARVDALAVALAGLAALALMRWRWGVVPVLACCGLAGALLGLR